jgi:hypothetical protein
VARVHAGVEVCRLALVRADGEGHDAVFIAGKVDFSGYAELLLRQGLENSLRLRLATVRDVTESSQLTILFPTPDRPAPPPPPTTKRVESSGSKSTA